MDTTLIFFLLIGMTSGWLARFVLKGHGYGRVSDLVAGVAGAVLSGWLFDRASVAAEGSVFGSLIVATLGAIALLFGVRLLKNM